MSARQSDPDPPFVYVDFSAQIKLTREDVQAAGSITQAVQNEVGPADASVVDIDCEEWSDE